MVVSPGEEGEAREDLRMLSVLYFFVWMVVTGQFSFCDVIILYTYICALFSLVIIHLYEHLKTLDFHTCASEEYSYTCLEAYST